ncbi:YBR138C [Zygosaccharomyces parabailii]|nr:YBR138C [Zygosaccharomyces parabailii]CDH12654.1 related to High-Dosage Reductional segregation defective [Zygosaccharomyces bailii ISA1307]
MGMDDSSQSRVLEPIDSNSLSLISSSSGNGNNTNESVGKILARPVTPSLLNNENGSAFGWQLDCKEFEFESRSTPSKKNDYQGHRQLLHARKRHSQLMGAKPRIPSRLHQSVSKLDLLDESSLTSLPIPPPIDVPPRKRSKLNPIHEMRIHNDSSSRRISYGIPQGYNMSEDDDEDAGHPIVMVEDYIPYNNEKTNKGFAKKKVSVSDLKTKMSKSDNMHVPLKLKKHSNSFGTLASSVTLVPHIMDESIAEELIQNEEHIADDVRGVLEDLLKPIQLQAPDRYLSNIANNTKLRKCVICETLLYEVSSLLAHRNDYKEIVCGKCTEKYEEAAKIFEEYEFESSRESSKNSSMSSMDSAEQLTDNGTEPWRDEQQMCDGARSRTKDNFSQELISRLQWQLQNSMGDTGMGVRKPLDFSMMTWFIEAKKKIRWRWRVSGLLPHFLTKKYRNVS